MSVRALIVTAVLALQMLSAQTDKPVVVPDGLLFNCWVRSDLSSTKSKVGDPVVLETVDAVKDLSGKPFMPARTKLTGTVTMVERKSKDGKPSLAIRLTDASWKDGSAKLNGVFGGEVMAKDSMEGMTGTSMTTHRGGDSFRVEGFEQAEGYTDQDEKLGAVLRAKHDIKLRSNNVVSIRTLP